MGEFGSRFPAAEEQKGGARAKKTFLKKPKQHIKLMFWLGGFITTVKTLENVEILQGNGNQTFIYCAYSALSQGENRPVSHSLEAQAKY